MNKITERGNRLPRRNRFLQRKKAGDTMENIARTIHGRSDQPGRLAVCSYFE